MTPRVPTAPCVDRRKQARIKVDVDDGKSRNIAAAVSTCRSRADTKRDAGRPRDAEQRGTLHLIGMSNTSLPRSHKRPVSNRDPEWKQFATRTVRA